MTVTARRAAAEPSHSGPCAGCTADWVCVACGKVWPEDSGVCDKVAAGEGCPPRIAYLEAHAQQSPAG